MDIPRLNIEINERRGPLEHGINARKMMNIEIKPDVDLQNIEDKLNQCYYPDFKVDVKIENEEDWCINNGADTEIVNLDAYEPSSSENFNNNNNLDAVELNGFKNSGKDLIKKGKVGKGNFKKGKASLRRKHSVESYSFDVESKDLVIDIQEVQEHNANNGPEIVGPQNVEFRFKCEDCAIVFYNDDNLLEHIRAIHGSKLQNHKNVTKEPPEIIVMDSDDEDFKPIEKQYECIVCNESFISTSSADFCESCNFMNDDAKESSSDSEDCLILNKGQKKDQMHTCKICDKTFKYKHWHGHMSQVHGTGSYTCTICKAEFKCATYLKRHIMFKHEGVPRSYERNVPEDFVVKCLQCPKTFKNNYNLTHHVKNCHGEPVQCEICHLTVKSKPYLLTHKRRIHENRFPCPICAKRLKSKTQLAVHIKNLHGNERHLCKYCGKEFKCKKYHNAHIKICPCKGYELIPICVANIVETENFIGTEEVVDVEA